MGYQNNNFKKNNNNRGTYNKTQSDRPRNKTITFSMKVSGVNANGREYDVNDALATLENLDNNGIFSMLSVPVHISRALLENNEERRGTSNVGFLKSISINDLTADVSVYGNNVEAIEGIRGLIFAPRVLVKDGKVATFLGFDLVSE
jgi:hypothetical protein